MKIVFSSRAWTGYLHWQENDRVIIIRVIDLIRETTRTPFGGFGKPEPLFDNLKGFWSRRITQEHRFVYRISGAGEAQALEIASCRFHYR